MPELNAAFHAPEPYLQCDHRSAQRRFSQFAATASCLPRESMSLYCVCVREAVACHCGHHGCQSHDPRRPRKPQVRTVNVRNRKPPVIDFFGASIGSRSEPRAMQDNLHATQEASTNVPLNVDKQGYGGGRRAATHNGYETCFTFHARRGRYFFRTLHTAQLCSCGKLSIEFALAE